MDTSRVRASAAWRADHGDLEAFRLGQKEVKQAAVWTRSQQTGGP
jgi:hypothetical protein